MVQGNEYNIYRILSGTTHIEFGGRKHIVKPPSFDVLCDAAELYDKSLRDAQLLGALTFEDLVHSMVANGLWSTGEEGEIDELPKQIDNIKEDLYLSQIKLQSIDHKRKALKQLEDLLIDKLKKKSRYRMLSAEGIADFHKMCFLVCAGCGLDYHGSIHLQSLYCEYLNNTVDFGDIRDLAREHVWLPYWSSIKLGNNLFGDMHTREQQSLIGWSKFYDNVHESSECPSTSIIEDNDLLDGWCINQKRKRDDADGKKAAENFGNGGEIFVAAEGELHAQRINDLNDARAKLMRRQQQDTIQQKGRVNAQDMPDVKLELRQQASNALREHVKG